MPSMPRAKANPDPAIQSHHSPKWGQTYTIRAWRSGAYQVFLGDRQIGAGVDPLVVAGGFGKVSYPSNRKQDEALQRARSFIDFGMLTAEG